jgi:hypothetical protein
MEFRAIFGQNVRTAYQVFIAACRLLDYRCEIHGYTRRWCAP